MLAPSMEEPFMRRAVLAVCLLFVAVVSAEVPPIPWDISALSAPPTYSPAEGFEEQDGCKPIFFTGLPWQGKPTRVFAWYAIPRGTPPNGKWPGIVLIHGGGGTAFSRWVRLWNDRGYAAIAMDTCGAVPRGEYGNWERDPQGGPPGWGGFEKAAESPQEQWPYFAVADAILANSLLRSLPEVDPERIGLTGISWGGYLTCIVAGVDPRFKAAAPVYGCGFLGDNSAWLDNFKQIGPELSKRWLSLWDPSVYLPRVTIPMQWVTGTNDFAYPMDSLQKSYRLPKSARELVIRVRMPHGHGSAGEGPSEIARFMDTQVKGRSAPTEIAGQGREGTKVWLKFKNTGPGLRAELNYTTDRSVWKDRLWNSVPAEVSAEKGMAAAELPKGTTVYYLNLIDYQGNVYSGEHEELPGN